MLEGLLKLLFQEAYAKCVAKTKLNTYNRAAPKIHTQKPHRDLQSIFLKAEVCSLNYILPENLCTLI